MSSGWLTHGQMQSLPRCFLKILATWKFYYVKQITLCFIMTFSSSHITEVLNLTLWGYCVWECVCGGGELGSMRGEERMVGRNGERKWERSRVIRYCNRHHRLEKQTSQDWRPLIMRPEETESPAWGGCRCPNKPCSGCEWIHQTSLPPPSALPGAASTTPSVPQTWFWCGLLLFQFLSQRKHDFYVF